MEVRFKFSADVYIKGDNMQEIRNKWEELNLFSWEAYDNGAVFCETLLIEDAETCEDLTDSYRNA